MLEMIIIKSFIILAEAFIAGLVLLKNHRSWVNRYLAATIIGIMVWGITSFLSDLNTITPLFWNRAVFVGPIIISWSFWLLAQELTKKRRNFFQRWVVGVASLAALVIISTGMVVEGVKIRYDTFGAFQGYDLVRGPLYTLFLSVFVGVMAWALLRMYGYSRGARGISKAQIHFILLGGVLATVWGLITNVVLTIIMGSSHYSQYGSFAGLIFTSLLAYAIVRHRFLDIRLILARSVMYMILLGTLAVIYAIAIFGFSRIFLGESGTTGQNITSTFVALVLAFTFQPLRRFFEKITNRIFYRDHYDSQEVLNKFTKILVSELELNRILKKALTALCEDLHIQYAQIVVFNDGRVYRVGHYGVLPRRLMVAPELAKLNASMIVADELDGGERKALLDKHEIRVSMTLRTRDEFIGYLLLGDKMSGDIYSNQDIRILEIIGKELAVAIQNAKAYAQIQEFNVTLQARVDHATNRLRVANRHLKELDHAKDEFISMASHQLRTPLTTIKGYLSMMLEGDAGRLTGSQKEFVGFAFGASERMVNLISDLLNVSRLSAGRFLIQARPTDMVQMIEDEVRQLQTHATAKGLKLIFDRPAHELPLVEIDDNKTRQVIMNFIDNAIYYTREGEVRVVLRQTGDRVCLEVRDTGIGVPAAAKKKLFTKFFRADNAQATRPDGTGLGLYLAKRVVQDQGGTIIFNSTEGKGSTFGFELPLRQAPVKKPQHEHEETHVRSKS